MSARQALRAPTLVLTDLKDVLHPNDRRVVEARVRPPGATFPERG